MKTFGTLKYVEASSMFNMGERGVWMLESTPDIIIRLKRMFPRADEARARVLHMSDTTEVCRDLEWVLVRWPLALAPADAERLADGATRHREREETVRQILAGEQPHFTGLLDPAREPYDYQLVAADLGLTNRELLLIDELGLGKSMSGLLLLRDPDALPALVVCPAHLPRQWTKELALTFPMLNGHIIRTVKVYDPSQRREMKGHDPDVLFTSYAKLDGWATHLAGRVRTVIFDEVQELRRSDSAKYKAACLIADEAHLRMGLTATPVYNYGGELHNIGRVLFPDKLGSQTEFAREWCGAWRWSDDIRVKDPKALSIHLREAGLILGRTRRDVNKELPAVLRVPHAVDADERVLKQVQQEIVDLAELIVSSDTPKQDVWKASGQFDMKMRQATGIAKAPYVAEFVRMLLDSEDKVVVWAWHREVYRILLERLEEFNPVMYTGSESPAGKDRSRMRFMGGEELEAAQLHHARSKRPPGVAFDPWFRQWEESRVLLMSLESGAGLDGLQKACHVGVFAELAWSPPKHDQCLGRLNRDGMDVDDPVVGYFLISNHGTDPMMAEILNVKRMQSEPIRDPNAPLIDEQVDTRDKIRRLAEEIVRKRGRRPALREAA